MAFAAKITFVPGLDPTTFQLEDTSNYASPDDKANISARTVSILQSGDTPLPGYTNPIAFPYSGGDFLTIAGLTQDVALQVIMTLTPISPQSGSTYVSEADIATTRFLELGLFNIQVQQNNAPYTSNKAAQQYRTNSIDLIVETQNSQTALMYDDFTASQAALNRGTQIIANTQL